MAEGGGATGGSRDCTQVLMRSRVKGFEMVPCAPAATASSTWGSVASAVIITTGTPPGVGSGMKPPKFLNVGDVVTLGIEGLGVQRQEIVAA